MGNRHGALSSQSSGRRRSLAVIGAVLLAAMSVMLCGPVAQAQQGGSWDSVLAGAKQEGKVVFYSAAPQGVVERLVAGFKKLHPDIAVEPLRGPSGQLLSKVEQERVNAIDGADVMISTEVAWFTDKAKAGQLLAPTGPSNTAWPAKYKVGDSVIIAGIEPFTIPYNTGLVKDPPKSYADLLKPEFTNKIGTSDLAATTLIAWYDWLDKTQGLDYLPKLKAQNPKLYVGTVPISQALAAGEIVVSAFGNTTSFTPLIQQGAPIKLVIPSPGLGFEYGLGAFGWSKRPNAARVFEDYVMSVDGQSAWHGGGESASPIGVPGSVPIDSITPWDIAAYPPDVVKSYTGRWNKIFK